MKYATEMEARFGFVAMCARYAGIKEGSAEHKELLQAYNEATEGYDMTVAAAWCAAFLSAIAAKLGYKNFPLECSCSRMLQKAEKLGIRIETYGYRPKVGDWLIYDLDLNSAMDHVGVVIGTEGDELWVLEGNYGDTVKSRCRIRYDDPRILRWICPDYTELVEQERATVGEEKPGAVKSFADVDSDAWYAGEVARAAELGIIQGNGDGTFSPDRPVTRAEAAAMMVRLHDILQK